MHRTRMKQKSNFGARGFRECRRPFSVPATSTPTTPLNIRRHSSRLGQWSVPAALPCCTNSRRRQSRAWNSTWPEAMHSGLAPGVGVGPKQQLTAPYGRGSEATTHRERLSEPISIVRGGPLRRRSRVHGIAPDDAKARRGVIAPHYGITPNDGGAVNASGQRVAPDDGVAPDDRVTPNDRVAPYDGGAPDARQVANQVHLAGGGVVLYSG